MLTTFPRLYKKSSTGKIQLWYIYVSDSVIVTEHSQVDGKIQVTEDEVTQGKNIGKANATTPETQAVAEAQSKWETKQKSKGYHQSIAAAESGEANAEFVDGGVSPMLAHRFDQHSKKVVYPAFVQPKLDGHRCIAIVNDDHTVSLWSRTRKLITGVPHISAAIEYLNFRVGTTLDGELYNHEYKAKFNELTSFIKQKTPKAGHEVVQYHVYDIVNDDPFEARSTLLAHLLPSPVSSGHPVQEIVFVETNQVCDEDELTETFAEYLADGYEGAMVRNTDSKYEQAKRSYGLQKLKVMADDEFKIVGMTEGRGKLKGCGIPICTTVDGNTFKAKPVGKLESLKDYWENADNYIGKMMTVQYQDISPYGVPRFPVGLRLREDV